MYDEYASDVRNGGEPMSKSSTTLFGSDERAFAAAISRLVYCNPFVPERIALERAALGEAFSGSAAVWSLRADAESERSNLAALVDCVEPLAERARERLATGSTAEPDDLVLYEDLVLYLLYQRDRLDFQRTIAEALDGRGSAGSIPYWRRFSDGFKRFLDLPGIALPTRHDAAHVFAMFFQIRRAFHHIFNAIVGGSMPAARLRAAVWESIFTHDMQRYYRVLHQHMVDYATLVTGPSGTGKELVARAIGQSRCIPFDSDRQRFAEDFATSFHALNLSAMSPTLIESELFGHKRGSFTGAVADRAGWLEVCKPHGTVFLDEVGELDAAIQVKLLRVLQTRTFNRIGESEERRFTGKIIAATNQDLARSMAEGRFRSDFYYRLCSDMITTPSLREQLADDPDDLFNLVLFITKRIVDDEAEPLAREVTDWIEGNLGRRYAWPGNFRELEQCVRNVLIRRAYHPARGEPAADSPLRELLDAIAAGRLSAEALLNSYCTLAYFRAGTYEGAARAIGLDRRTIRARVDRDLLERLRDGGETLSKYER
jgi:hypothetical protein